MQEPSDSSELPLTAADHLDRLFVTGVTNADDAAEQLRVAFEAYEVTEVQVFAKRGFAFVTFASTAGAQRALAATSAESGYNSSVFTDVKPAVRDSGKHRSKRRTDMSKHAQAELVKLSGADNITLALLAPASHVQRLCEYLASGGWSTRESKLHVLATASATNRQCAEKVALLVDTAALEASAVAAALRKNRFLSIAINKALVLSPMPPITSLQAAVETAASLLITAAAEEPDGILRLRLSTFPPILATTLAHDLPVAFAEQCAPSAAALQLVLSPARYSAVLSLMELEDGFRVGIERLESGSSAAVECEGARSEKRVCRAYYKLSEALGRYSLDLADEALNQLIDLHRLQPRALYADTRAEGDTEGVSGRLLTAVDCGAAPGGWTQLLAQSGCCSTVFAVDPGDLELGLDVCEAAGSWKRRITHMRCKSQDAISSFGANGLVADIWVSDMCLKEMEAQHDIFRAAFDANILRRSANGQSGALVVLTLKCCRGRSKESFDVQVAKEVARLDEVLTGVQVMHLMSNRSGERTVVGLVR